MTILAMIALPPWDQKYHREIVATVPRDIGESESAMRMTYDHPYVCVCCLYVCNVCVTDNMTKAYHGPIDIQYTQLNKGHIHPTIHTHHTAFCCKTNMRSQYPDHGHFESQRVGGGGGILASIMTYLSNTVSLETVSCILYVLALVYTAGQCVALGRWAMGMPVVVVAGASGGSGGSKAGRTKRD